MQLYVDFARSAGEEERRLQGMPRIVLSRGFEYLGKCRMSGHGYEACFDCWSLSIKGLPGNVLHR
jgi:hypothetical protein